MTTRRGWCSRMSSGSTRTPSGSASSARRGTIRLAWKTLGQLPPTVPKPVGLLLSEDDLRAQRAGGTWTDIVKPDGIASRMPVLAWLVVMQLMALAILPIALAVFRSLPDGGYLLAKLLGILVVSLVAWLLASLQWMAFSFGSVLVGIGAVGLASCVVLGFTWSSFWSFLRERWRVIAICEVVFIAAFLAFVVLRMANPDLWHPWQGGEKPMDTAYLNAVLKSSFMPPYDPWYAGGYLNYYYWGQFIVASFIHATGIDYGHRGEPCRADVLRADGRWGV